MFSIEDAERELAHYHRVITDRDPMVRRSLQAGVSKNRIHTLTGISRTTIDRIPTQEDSVHLVYVIQYTTDHARWDTLSMRDTPEPYDGTAEAYGLAKLQQWVDEQHEGSYPTDEHGRHLLRIVVHEVLSEARGKYGPALTLTGPDEEDLTPVTHYTAMVTTDDLEVEVRQDMLTPVDYLSATWGPDLDKPPMLQARLSSGAADDDEAATKEATQLLQEAGWELEGAWEADSSGYGYSATVSRT